MAGQRLDQPTFHERYEAMPPETRAELVDGVVYMPSPMRHDHGQESRVVTGWLDNYQRLTPGVDGGDGSTLKLDLRGEPQADHHLRIPAEVGGQSDIDSGRLHRRCAGAGAEVARSTRSFDLNAKKADYERAGVREYVVVELDPNRIHWFFRPGDCFADLPPGPDGIYRSEVFPGLWLDPRATFCSGSGPALPDPEARDPLGRARRVRRPHGAGSPEAGTTMMPFSPPHP